MLTTLLITLITFAANSVVLALYFSALVRDYASKVAIHRDGLKIAFPGTIVASIFTFLGPILPRLMPLGPFSSPIDIGVSAAGILWVVLTRRYCQTGWLSAIMMTVVAVIVYMLIMLFIGGFFLLLTQF